MRRPDHTGAAGARASTSTRSTRTSTARRSGDRHGLADRPVIVCVSRLVPRKGQDTLIRALPAIRRRVPDAALLIVGGGPYRATAGARWPARPGSSAHVVFTGSVPWAELPAHYAAGDVLRDAVPHPPRRAGRGGPRHRLPGGVGDRAAGGRRRLRRRAGRGPRGRDRVRRRRPRRRRARRPAGRRCSTTGDWRPGWARPAGPGSRRSGAGSPRRLA